LGGNSLAITNKTTGDVTKVNGIALNEVITISDNMVIKSDNPIKRFGNNFNFVFPKLVAGDNELAIDGTGHLTFQYITPVKLGDIAIDLNAVSDPICDPDGNIQLDMLDWSRISNTPNTLAGYGIKDAYSMSSVYNKKEIDDQNKNLESHISAVSSSLKDNYYKKTYIDDNFYDKLEIDHIISQLTYDPSTGTEATVMWAQIVDKPTTLSGYRIETEVKNMIDKAVAAVQVDIDETELEAMLNEVLG
jgi:hypothetical protein